MKAELSVKVVETRTVTLTLTDREAKQLAGILESTVHFEHGKAGEFAEDLHDELVAASEDYVSCNTVYDRGLDLMNVDFLE
jgi:hypothetical protein